MPRLVKQRKRLDAMRQRRIPKRRVAAAGLLSLWAILSGWPPCEAAASRPVQQAQAQMPQRPNVEADIAQLHQRLAIAPAQEPQFAAFANIMRENARAMPAGPPPGNPNAVEALRLAIQYGQQDLDGMRRLLPALQALYASLSPAQRRTADQVFRQGPGE
jgi:hypothetical protein